MADLLKPNKKHEHIYAILRYETDAGPDTPIDFRVTVKKVVSDPDYAEREVRRLNDLNQEKGSYYFYQITRFEDVPARVEVVPPAQWAAAGEPQA
jgi:hypothetical protein